MIPGIANIVDKRDPTSETMSDAKTAIRTLAKVVEIIISDLLPKIMDSEFAVDVPLEEADIANSA